MFDVVKTAGLAYRPSSKIRSGEHVTSSPFSSNSPSNCAAPQVRAPRLLNPSRKDLSRKWPAVPASSSAWSAFHYLGASCCQHMLKLCSACQKTGLIYLAFQQIREKKNHLKKERLTLGTLFLGECIMDISLFPSSRPQHS